MTSSSVEVSSPKKCDKGPPSLDVTILGLTCSIPDVSDCNDCSCLRYALTILPTEPSLMCNPCWASILEISLRPSKCICTTFDLSVELIVTSIIYCGQLF